MKRRREREEREILVEVRERERETLREIQSTFPFIRSIATSCDCIIVFVAFSNLPGAV